MPTDLTAVQHEIATMRPMSEITAAADNLYMEVSGFIDHPIAVADRDGVEVVNARAALARDIREQIAELFRPWSEFLFRAHRSVTARRADYLAALEAFERKAGAAIVGYQNELQRRADEEARQAQAAALAAALREREAEINAALERGDQAAVNELAADPVETPPEIIPAVANVMPKGVSARETWKAVITDMAKARESLPRDLLLPDEKALDALAKSTRGPSKYAGVAFEKVTTTARARRG